MIRTFTKLNSSRLSSGVNKMYKTTPVNIQEHKDSITLDCRGIIRQTFTKVCEEFLDRLYYYLPHNGAHFENLIIVIF